MTEWKQIDIKMDREGIGIAQSFNSLLFIFFLYFLLFFYVFLLISLETLYNLLKTYVKVLENARILSETPPSPKNESCYNDNR